MDDNSAPICTCVTSGLPVGPLCERARDVRFASDVYARKHGGSSECPRACGECDDGAHHFTESDMQPIFNLEDDLDDDEDRAEQALLRKHPAALAGCEMWYECKHCNAWMQASVEDDDENEDYEPDSMDLDEDPERPDDDFCDGCDELTQNCICDDEDDDGT